MLSKKDIDNYFLEINDRLNKIGKHGEIVMAGGAALTVVFNARGATHDIDALFKPSIEFREIIEQMAQEHGLEKDWLNDGVKGFFTDKLKADLYKSFSNLEVYSIDAEGLLALKLTSARRRSKDMEDSIMLMKHLEIQNIEELYGIIEKYTSSNQQSPNSYFFTQEAFEQYQEHK